MSKTIGGKKALSSKPKSGPALDVPDFFTKKQDVPARVMKELKDQNLECRWIDYGKYVNNSNTHERGWSVYKSKVQQEQGVDQFMAGISPDGIIRRGTLVLAARPVAWGDKHREYNRQRSALYSQEVKQGHSESMRELSRQIGNKVYEDDKE